MPVEPLIINALDYSMELSDEELTSCSGGLFVDILPGKLDIKADVNVPLGSYTLHVSANGSIRCTTCRG